MKKERVSSCLDEATDQISSLEDKVTENTQSEQQKENIIFRKWDFKGPLGQHRVYQHSHHQGTRRRRESTRIENLVEEITTENFPNLGKEIDIQVWEVQKVPN